MARMVLSTAPQRFALAGHSMGGRVALEIMRLAPERVARLALLDTGCHALLQGADGDPERQARARLTDLAQGEGMRAMAQNWINTLVHPA